MLHGVPTAPKCPGFTVTWRFRLLNIFPCGSNSPGNLTSPPGQQEGHNGHGTCHPHCCCDSGEAKHVQCLQQKGSSPGTADVLVVPT